MSCGKLPLVFLWITSHRPPTLSPARTPTCLSFLPSPRCCMLLVGSKDAKRKSCLCIGGTKETLSSQTFSLHTAGCAFLRGNSQLSIAASKYSYRIRSEKLRAKLKELRQLKELRAKLEQYGLINMERCENGWVAQLFATSREAQRNLGT